jgi:hypothetical protein
MPPISFQDCDFNLTMPDGSTQTFKGHDAFLDHLLSEEGKSLVMAAPTFSPEQVTADTQRATDLGFDHPAQVINSVAKRTGVKYPTMADIPEDVLKEVAEERGKEKLDEVHNMLANGIDPADKSAIKKVDAFFNKMYLDTSGKNTYALPIPPQIINAAIRVIHTAAAAGVKMAEAVQKGIEYLRSQGVEGDDLDAAHYEIREKTGLNTELKSKAQDYILDGRTDEKSLSYLIKQGVSKPIALAILGDAKSNPIPAKDRKLTLENAIKEHFKLEDQWLGEKENIKFKSQQEARGFQERIQKATPKRDANGKKQSWKDVDRAIHVYLDLQRNPEHATEMREHLTPEQVKILDMAQNLTPEQKQIANDIKSQYQQVGLQAKNEGLIKDVLDNYVARAWNFENKDGSTDMFSKLKTSSRHSLERSLDTILEGWSKGYKLKIEGASNNLQALKVEIGNVLESKKLIQQGLDMKYDTGVKDEEGKPIFAPLLVTHEPKDGRGVKYAKINSPYYKKWVYAGKLEDVTQETAKAYGMRRDILITEDGTIMAKEDVYAPEKIAKSLNNILDRSALADTPGIAGLTELNRAMKTTILSFSGYHYFAFSRAHILAGQTGGKIANVNPVTAFKGGLNLMAAQDPHLSDLIKGGMTIGRAQDFQEGMTEHLTWLDQKLDKLGWPGDARAKMVGVTDAIHKHLFETYGAGLKAFDGVNLYRKELDKAGKSGPVSAAQRTEIATAVGRLMNDTYGGINWQRMHGNAFQSATVRHVSSLALLAVDWTSSNLRFFKNAFSKGYEGQLYRRIWGQTLARGLTIGAITNAGMAAMAGMVGEDNDGENWEQRFLAHYKRAWMQGQENKANTYLGTKITASIVNATSIDLTALYHLMGGDKDHVMYYPIFGAYLDPIKAATDPVKFIDNKLAVLPKVGLEFATGKDWQGKAFTTWDELMGMDDKGQYTRKYKNKKTGEVFLPGMEKGGKLEGQLTKWDYTHTGLSPDQYLSFMLNQVRGAMPVSAQNLWQSANGERDWAYGLMNMLGLGVSTQKKTKSNE